MDVGAPIAAAISAWLAAVVGATLGPALQTAGLLIVATPQLDASPAVVASWRAAQQVANALLVVAWTAAGVLVMTSAGDGRYTLKALLPRAVLATLAANASLSVCGALIAFNNQLVRASLGPETDGAALLAALLSAPGTPHDLLGILVALATAVLAVVLVGVGVIRDVLLVLTTIIAPPVIALYVLPPTEVLARTWARVYPALVFAQCLQVAIVQLGRSVLRDADPALLPAAPLVAGVLAITLLYLLVRVPFVAIDLALRANANAVPFARPVVVGLRALRG
jgi:hypothetical protein